MISHHTNINFLGSFELSKSFSPNFSALAETNFELSWNGPSIPGGIDIEYFLMVMNSSGAVVFSDTTRNNSVAINGLVSPTDACSEFNFTVQAVSSNEEIGNSSVIHTLQKIPISKFQ